MTQKGNDDAGENFHEHGDSITPINAILEDAGSTPTDDEREGEFITIEKRFPKDYEECPNCFEGDNRWIYKCDSCGFIGCYDGVYDYGCYAGDPDERACPECESKVRIRIGRVGIGSEDGSK